MRIAGTKVVDATKPLRIEITKTDVRLGDTKSAAACAAARALLRTTGCEQARVHLGRTYVKLGSKWTRYETPESLRSEIIAFDRGGSFEPGEYTLKAVRASHREGVRQGTSDKKRTVGPKKRRAKPHMVTGVRQHGANR